jgi:two-component system response regulator AtoC
MALKCLGFAVEIASDGDEVLACLRDPEVQISAVLLDMMMPNRDGLETLLEIRRTWPALPVIVVSGAASTLNVVKAMKMGATDFLCKPVAHEDLEKALTRALEMQSAAPSMPSIRKSAAFTKAFMGRNPRMAEVQALVGQIAWSEAPVLIQGETGTGKEVIARELHAQSPRANKGFLKLNCAALPSELVESELFGYERGAFTGAFQKKAGMFELADGGTILLDEIGDMDVRLQAKLLQVLQDREFTRIGGRETIKVDVRVMAATHRDLEGAIAERTFREDLYYRLNVINLVLPPLRERTEDIVPMAEFLMRKHSTAGVPMPTITPELARALTNYRWPGNVRELENVVRKFLILRDAAGLAAELQAKAFRRREEPTLSRPEPVAQSAQPSLGTPILEQVTKAKQQAETDAILAALNSTRWNRKRAAALLEIDYKALLYKMKKLGVEDRPTPMGVASETLAKSALVGTAD